MVGDGKSPIAVIWGPEGFAPSSIAIENPSGQPQTVHATLSDPAQILDLADKSDIKIPEHSVQLFKLTRVAPWPTDGQSHFALLTLKAVGGTSLLKLTLEIKPAELKSALPKLQYVSTNSINWPTRSWNSRIEVPLARSAGLSAPLPPNSVIGQLVSDHGEHATVRWKQDDTSTDSAVAATPIDRRSLSGIAGVDVEDLKPGHYEGTISFNSGAEQKSPITLTVIAQTSMLWPLLTIAVGVVLATLIAGVGNARNAFALGHQILELTAVNEQAKKAFHSAVSGTPTRYNANADFEIQQRQLSQGVIGFFAKRLFLPIDNDYKTFVTERVAAIGVLQEQLQALPQLGADVKALSHLVERVASKVGHPPASHGPGLTREPRCIETGRRLVLGHIITCADIESVRKQIHDQSQLLENWIVLYLRLLAGSSAIKHSLPRLAHAGADAAAIRALEDAMAQYFVRLWEVDALDGLHEVATHVDELWAKYAGLLATLNRRPDGAVSLTSGAAVTVASGLIFSPFKPSSSTPQSDARKAMLLRRAVILGDWTTALWGFAIAALTGLSLYYFGKPFGSLEDYIALFLWSASAKVAVDMFVGFATRLASLAPVR